jgi:hypothetical protein
MARRGRRRHVRVLVYAPAFTLGIYAWAALHEPAHWAGLGLAEIIALVAWPLVVLGLLMLPALAAAMMIPRRWRIAHRILDKTRPATPRWLRRVIFSADMYRCVACHRGAGQIALQLDHYRPWAGGGPSSMANLMTLCAGCNRVKSDYWRDDDGYVHYHPFHNARNEVMARAILAAERRARRNPLRWLRMAWALS